MKRSTDRILTTHCGSLARPKDLLDLMKAKINAEPYDETAFTQRDKARWRKLSASRPRAGSTL